MPSGGKLIASLTWTVEGRSRERDLAQLLGSLDASLGRRFEQIVTSGNTAAKARKRSRDAAGGQLLKSLPDAGQGTAASNGNDHPVGNLANWSQISKAMVLGASEP